MSVDGWSERMKQRGMRRLASTRMMDEHVQNAVNVKETVVCGLTIVLYPNPDFNPNRWS